MFFYRFSGGSTVISAFLFSIYPRESGNAQQNLDQHGACPCIVWHENPISFELMLASLLNYTINDS